MAQSEQLTVQMKMQVLLIGVAEVSTPRCCKILVNAFSLVSMFSTDLVSSRFCLLLDSSEIVYSELSKHDMLDKPGSVCGHPDRSAPSDLESW
ncbi:hypothetical protein KCV03_g258, partial [Aureobasidium melanogenum]